MFIGATFVIMNAYDAIRYMRQRSEAGTPFSITFMSYSYDRHKSEGVVTIEHAKLLKSSSEENNRFSDYMLNIRDLDSLDRRSCWWLLLLEVDGIEVQLT